MAGAARPGWFAQFTCLSPFSSKSVEMGHKFSLFFVSEQPLSSLETCSTRTPTNPQVSVRTRGVMEKCTYCVQRLNAHRRNKSEELPQTACQQACPRGAIRLVDLRHHAPAEVITSFDAPGTRPRTLYI